MTRALQQGVPTSRSDDADARWRQWSTAPGGTDVEPVDTNYGTREGAHIDPDGNLLSYGPLI